MQLSTKDVRTVLDLSYQVGSVPDPEDRQQIAMRLTRAAIGADIALVVNVDLVGRTVALAYEPPPEWERASVEILTRLAGQHPLIHHYLLVDPLTRVPLRVSDLVPARQWYRTQIYDELFRLMNARHQLAVPLVTEPTDAAGFAFNRLGSDFGGRAVNLATAIQPTLVALHLAGRIGAVSEAAADRAREQCGITRRELEVLRLLAGGLTAGAIGRVLRVREATVRKHLEHAYTKLGRRDRLGAVTEARRVGLLPPAGG